MRENRSRRELSFVCFFVSWVFSFKFTNQSTVGQKGESVLFTITNRDVSYSYFRTNLYSIYFNDSWAIKFLWFVKYMYVL